MKINFLLILIFFSTYTFATTRVEKTADINKDGKVDFIEIYKDGVLIEKKEDLNFDGTFDRQTLFAPAAPDNYFKVIDEKKNGTNPRKRISYWHDSVKKKSFSLTLIDEDNDGKWDKEILSSSDLYQKKDQCSEEDAISRLANDALKAASLSDEFERTGWGHLVHKSCLTTDREWFLNNTEKAIKEGLSCLSNLATNGGMGAGRNFASLTNLLEQANVQIICNEYSYDWSGGTIAHATTSTETLNTTLKHPGISVNPDKIRAYRSEGDAGTNEFVRTMFHEQLHNLGYLHGHDVEYAYSCEKCCFPDSGDSQDARDISCKICSGNYNSAMDISYLRDFTIYGDLNYERGNSIKTNLNFLRANPGSIKGLSFLSVNLSGVFNPVGGHLAQKLKPSTSLDDEDKKLLSAAETYNGSDLFKKYDASSKSIAEAYYIAFHSKNPAQALARLKADSATIKRELNQTADDDGQYVADNIRSSLKRLIHTVWLDEYSGSITDQGQKEKLNMEAYELHQLFNF